MLPPFICLSSFADPVLGAFRNQIEMACMESLTEPFPANILAGRFGNSIPYRDDTITQTEFDQYCESNACGKFDDTTLVYKRSKYEFHIADQLLPIPDGKSLWLTANGLDAEKSVQFYKMMPGPVMIFLNNKREITFLARIPREVSKIKPSIVSDSIKAWTAIVDDNRRCKKGNAKMFEKHFIPRKRSR
jgi:hypothetical protein